MVLKRVVIAPPTPLSQPRRAETAAVSPGDTPSLGRRVEGEETEERNKVEEEVEENEREGEKDEREPRTWVPAWLETTEEHVQEDVNGLVDEQSEKLAEKGPT